MGARENRTNRVEYIDVLKFIGILFIYIGHYLNSAGLLYNFVFEFHVPLFFVLSGCTEKLSRERNSIKKILKKFMGIMVPFYFFALASIIVKTLVSGGNLHTILDDLILIVKGCIRNTYFASSLWFLSCLFVVSVFFELMKKLKYPVLIVAFSICIYIANKYISFPAYYNINSACHYQIYFVIGYLLFDKIHVMLTSEQTVYKRFKWLTGLYAFSFTALLFFKHNIYTLLNNVAIIRFFVPVVTALTAIWFFFIVAYMLKDITIFSDLGKETLYFCGSEYMIKTVMNSLIGIFVSVQVTNGLSALMYSFILLLVAHKYIVPIETKLLSLIKSSVYSCLPVKGRKYNYGN